MSKTETGYPEVTVGALVFDSKKRILLVKTHKWSGLFCIPGGHIEFGEKAIDAVVREVKEETNLDIADIEFHMIEECIFNESFHEKKKHFVFLDYICHAQNYDVILNDEAQEYAWVQLSEIENYKIEKYTLISIRQYIDTYGLM